ncbi:MAG TPA: cytochrome c maturation protein CcmE, partial [Ramlibacter sp.]|nr:cytochrome c maturation protein CcmE [Ramlibacter sp.]
ALNSNIALYVTPTDVAAGKAPKDQAFRIGGMVKDGSVRRDNLTVHFVVTDMAKDIPVSYTGILPDLFKEGKGAVVQGKLGPDGNFTASEVLAKHDENYMPPQAQHSLDEAKKNQGAKKP